LEQPRALERLAADTRLALAHDIQQRAPDLNRCAASLVDQQQVAEEGP
jgi:hypothetical protein